MKQSLASKRLLDSLNLPLMQIFGSTYCNLKCPYCSQGDDRSSVRHGDLFASEKFLAGLEGFPKTHFYVSGGEPLMHEGIYKFLAAVVGHGHVVSVDTNGMIAKDALVRLLDALPREQWGFFNISHHLLAGVPFEQMLVVCSVLRNAAIPHFVKYVGAPESIPEIAGNMQSLRDAGSGVAVTILQTFSTPWNGRSFPRDYTNEELIALLNMVTLATHGMQFFGGIESFGCPCLAGSAYVAYNMKDRLELNACCHRSDLLQWSGTVWGDARQPFAAPCKAETCLGDLMFVLGVQGLGQEKQRFAEVCMGNSPVIGLEKACASIKSLVGQSRLLYGKRFDDFCEDVLGDAVPVRKMTASPAIDKGEDASENTVLDKTAEGEFGGYEYAVYSEDGSSGKPVIGEDLIFAHATIQDHAAIPFFPVQPAARESDADEMHPTREKMHFLLQLDFSPVADVSCQWRIEVQDDGYNTLAMLCPPHMLVEHPGFLRMSAPFIIKEPNVSRIRLIFRPEVRLGEVVLPSRIRVERIRFFEKVKVVSREVELPQYSNHLPAAVRYVRQNELGAFLRDKIPAAQWADSENLPTPPAYDDLTDARVLRYLFRNFRPGRHLEFGTWKGNGVRRVLEECGDASVWTINIWEGESKPDGTWAYNEQYKYEDTAVAGTQSDGLFIRTDAGGMIGIEYLRAGLGCRVSQIYSDSRLWNDSAYPDGFFDSVFIDGGHDAATSRSDLHKALRLLRPGGLLLVHDFCSRPEAYAQFPSTVGVTNMVAGEIKNITAMCSDCFWIEDTWLFCGIRGGE